jgi:hypothetical protein
VGHHGEVEHFIDAIALVGLSVDLNASSLDRIAPAVLLGLLFTILQIDFLGRPFYEAR